MPRPRILPTVVLSLLAPVATAATALAAPVTPAASPPPPAPPDPASAPAVLAPALAAAPAAGATSALASPDLWTAAAEAAARYEAETTCSNPVKPGLAGLRDEILKPAFGGPASDYGTYRTCSSASSGHEEGRALDWMMDTRIAAERENAQAFINWLLATDAKGNKYAQARRLGVMYLIYDRKQWRAYRPDDGFTAYSGPSPHIDHIHISLSWAGARKETSYWKAPAGVRPGTLGTYPGSAMSVGVRSDAVLRYERRLSAVGHLSPAYVDGYFGTATRSGTEAFQRRTGLVVDGRAGSQTWAKANATGLPDAAAARRAAETPVPAAPE